MQWSITGNIRRLRRKSLVGQLVLFALGIELLLFASFTCVPLPTASGRNLEHCLRLAAQRMLVYLPPRYQGEVVQCWPALTRVPPPVRFSGYVPLIPGAIFTGYVLGLPLGMLSVLGFVMLGLCGAPLSVLPFAGGGGLDYCRQPSFGYLLGLVIAAWFAGRVTVSSHTSWRQLLVIGGGLLLAHGIGLLFLVGGSLGLLLFEGDAAYLNWQPWLFENIRNLSWYCLPYDALFSLAAVGLAFPFRWLTATLTAPDIVSRARPKFEPALEQVT